MPFPAPGTAPPTVRSESSLLHTCTRVCRVPGPGPACNVLSGPLFILCTSAACCCAASSADKPPIPGVTPAGSTKKHDVDRPVCAPRVLAVEAHGCAASVLLLLAKWAGAVKAGTVVTRQTWICSCHGAVEPLSAVAWKDGVECCA
jgi:hypothetical protein